MDIRLISFMVIWVLWPCILKPKHMDLIIPVYLYPMHRLVIWFWNVYAPPLIGASKA